ncbi:MAG: hypothetical protein ACYTF1_23185 [Planctomycetota bacterium]
MKREDYLDKWKQLSPIVVKMIEKEGKCNHELGETFYFENPYAKPMGLCNALVHVLDLYTWRVELGFPSWEEDDESVYRIHCPSKKGSVWEMKKANRSDYQQYHSIRNNSNTGAKDG